MAVTETDYQALSALLDFNSDRAEAHAALLVAIVFGLFTLLSVLENSPKDMLTAIVYSGAYLILWFGGFWEVFAFHSYATRADHFRRQIRDMKPSLCLEPIEKMEKEKAKKVLLIRWYSSLRENKHLRDNKLYLIAALYAIVGFLALLSASGLLSWLSNKISFLSSVQVMGLTKSQTFIILGLVFEFLSVLISVRKLFSGYYDRLQKGTFRKLPFVRKERLEGSLILLFLIIGMAL